LPFFILSLTADTSDKHIKNIANARKTSLWLFIQLLIATLPKPKLTRISEACQQKAKTKADIIEPILLNILINCCSLCVHAVLLAPKRAPTVYCEVLNPVFPKNSMPENPTFSIMLI